jgi:hypothetical protein
MSRSWKVENGVMPADLRASLEQYLRNNNAVFDRDEAPAPPWNEFPEYKRYSMWWRMGWRMGSGEDFIHGFRKWFRELSAQEQVGFTRQNPEPEGWDGFYQNTLNDK